MKKLKSNATFVATTALLAFGTMGSAQADDYIISLPEGNLSEGTRLIVLTANQNQAFSGDGVDVYQLIFPDSLYNLRIAVTGDQWATTIDSIMLTTGDNRKFIADGFKVGPYGFAFMEGITARSNFEISISGYGSGYTLYAVADTASPVPELETYAMFMAGLAGMGFISFRQKQRS